MDNFTKTGASVSIRKKNPSIDLVSVIDYLSKVLDYFGNLTSDSKAENFFSCKTRKNNSGQHQPSSLIINTVNILSGIDKGKNFAQEFTPSENSGLIRDVDLSLKSIDTIVGGEIYSDKAQDLTKSVLGLKGKIEKLIESCLKDNNLNVQDLCFKNAQDYVAQINSSLKSHKLDAETMNINFNKLSFADPVKHKQSGHAKKVARVITGIEEKQASGWLDDFKIAARRKLEIMETEEDEIEDIINNIDQEAARSGSQTEKFYNFLEDEVLARVRLEVSFAIMKEIRDHAKGNKDRDSALLVRYIDNALELKNKYLNTEDTLLFELGNSVRINLFDRTVNLSDKLRNALFYKCLPIWPHPSSHFFESRSSDGNHLLREVGYRFRVNGINPEAGKKAILARIDSIKDELYFSKNTYNTNHKHNIMELLYLSLVFPSPQNFQKIDDVILKCKSFLNQSDVKIDPVEKLIKRLNDLEEEGTYSSITNALIKILQQNSGQVLKSAERQIEDLYICVQEDVVDWERLATSEGEATDFFVKPADYNENEKITWLKNIEITTKPSTVAGLLFSIKIKTRLNELLLVQDDPKTYSISAQRKPEGPILPVSIIPHTPTDGGLSGTPVMDAGVPKWCDTGGIIIQVDDEVFSLKSENPSEAQMQLRSALVTLFAVLMQITLWVVREKLAINSAGQHKEMPKIFMLRLQKEGKGGTDKPPSGSEAIYAVFKALELTLGHESSVFMQGLVLDKISKYSNTGASSAILSGFPLVMKTDAGNAQVSNFEPMGILNYATRPCNQFGDTSNSLFLMSSKSYTAFPQTDPFQAMILEEGPSRLNILGESEFDNPKYVFEEISRLERVGCKNIILLWHHHGTWRIGRTAERHAPHSKPDFIERAAQRFPELTLYLFRRDFFPAIRISGQSKQPEAFEVQRASDHSSFQARNKISSGREIIPFYTFATLFVVATEQERPQSGFCTYYLEFDSRVSSVEWAEKARATIIDSDRSSIMRPAIITALRGLHYLHAEKPVSNKCIQPKLYPYDWIKPPSIGGLGEMHAIKGPGKPNVIISFPAVLSRVTSVLRSTA